MVCHVILEGDFMKSVFFSVSCRKVEVRLQDLEPQVLKITHSDEEEETNNNLPLTSSSHSNQDDDDELDDDVDDDDDVGVYIPPTPSDSPIDGRVPTPPKGPRSPIRAPVRPKTTAGQYITVRHQ